MKRLLTLAVIVAVAAVEVATVVAGANTPPPTMTVVTTHLSKRGATARQFKREAMALQVRATDALRPRPRLLLRPLRVPLKMRD